jgi:phytanoyl-CoA hydroxylase
MNSTYAATSRTSRLVLSQQHIDDFATNGYLAYGKVLDDYEIELFRREYDMEIDKGRREGYLANLAAADEPDDSHNAQMLQVFGVSTQNMAFRKLVHADRILNIVEDLIGPNIRLLQAHLLYKPPFHGSTVYWHQDNFYHQCFPANMVSGWLSLDDADRDNGAMFMLPGSHLRPSWEDWGEHTEGLDTSNATLVGVPAGGIIFHHCQVLHRSLPNASDRPRRAIVMRFVPIGTQSPRIRSGEWSYFVHPILRMKV